MHRQWIDHCLQSLAHSSIPLHPIVIDNLSTDGTKEHVSTHYPDVIWLPQESNLGFGQANNIGIRYALQEKADYILLLNQDATIAPDAVEKMLAVSDGQSLLSPLHLNGDGTALDFIFRNSLKRSDNSMLDDYIVSHRLQDHYLTGEICAACWFMPARLLHEIGGFNPLFFHYGEDNNYYQRLVYHGIKTIVVTQATMCHDRLVFGNIQAFNHHQLRRDLLVIACNINMSFSLRIANYMRIFTRCYLYDLKKRKYIPGGFLKELTWLLFHLTAIRKSRKIEKKTGSHWL